MTFLFSDIEGSTALLTRLGNRYARVLENYQKTIRGALAVFAGEEVDTAGDGFFAVFEDAGKAVATVVQCQRAFGTEPWATEVGLRVRMGLHTGEAIATPSGFIGIDIHRASRICSAAHGGQVLLSASTTRAAGKQLPEGVTIRLLGNFMLKDFTHPEELSQLIIPGTPSEFPLPRTEFPVPTLAVLPFVDRNVDSTQEHLCDGMAEEIIIALGKIPGLRVVARSSSFALKDQNLNIKEIGNRLNARYILEGSLRKNNGRIRVTAELVDTVTGYNLWSSGFDRKLEDIFTVQDDIADKVASTLRTKLVYKQVRAIKSVQTSNVRAYDFYLQGRRYFYDQFSPKGIEKAIQFFERAIDIDPEYALAYCGLANCYAYQYMYVDNKPEKMRRAQRASQRAIQLDPLLAEAFVAHGLTLSLDNRFPESEDAFDRAIDLDPQLFEARYLYGRVCFVQGKFEKAALLFEEANRLRPEDYQSALLAGQAYDDLGLPEKAVAARRRGIRSAAEQLKLNPGDVRALYLGANGLVALGEKEKGREWLERALELDPEDSMLQYNAGCIYSLLGMREEALECLEKSVAGGLTQRGWYANDSNLDGLRDHPRFKALLERLD
jgi:adenylate cyclase